jgi:hypothetical protein
MVWTVFFWLKVKTRNRLLRTEVLTAMEIQVEFFRVVTPCNVAVGYQRF